MNKKFSTFLTAGLLIGGSLFSYVDAKDIKGSDLASQVTGDTRVLAFDNDLSYTLISDCDLKNGILVIETQGATLDGGGKTFKGRIVVNAEGVTIKNLTLTSKSDGYGYWQKNGISVFADKVTVTNVDFTAPTSSKANAYVGNSLVIYPKAGKSVSYEISGNTFRAGLKTSDGYTSAGILVAAGDVTSRDGDPISGSKSGVEITDKKFDLIKVANGNTFENCWLDYALTSTDGEYQVAKVTPSKQAGALNVMVPDLANNATDNHTLIIDAAVADVETHAKKITDKNVAIQCSDANLLLGEGKAPNNGKPSLLSGVMPLQKEVAGAKLYESATGEYAMLIMRSGKKDYAIKAEDNGKGVDKITEAMASQDEFLWRMTSGKNADGSIWYRFESKKLKDGKPVVVLGEGTDAWMPVNNVAYNKFGVAFKKSGANLDGSNKTYFGLYKAGNNLLEASDLNWYEKDGFSVTIKYEDPKTGKFTKTDIAGNPFVGHLTPMIYEKDGDKKFHPATAETEFYLKDAKGNYIVAQKYASNGSVTAQSTYTFTTISAKDMAHEIEKAEGKYFGLFHAEVSAKYTDLQALKAIDALCVMVDGEEHAIGRLDLGTKEVPTLAASKDTELKPIVVALGSNDIVNPKDLLKRGKFYTVEIIAAPKGEKTGFLSVAEEDEYNGYYIVSNYGNDLEVQWALTLDNGNYVLTNRETPSYSHDLSVRGLYKTAKADEYRYSSYTLRIKTVAEHAATDGYKTLADLQDNKFNIGFSSNVFDSNAWFTENHSGTSNHTIGLDPTIENALEFTAIEYAAERKHEHHHDVGTPHDDTYTPSDSIYVISRLGYINADGDYKEDFDTLKVVSYSFVNQFTEPLIYNFNEQKLESKVYKDADKKVRFATVAEAAGYAQKFAIRKDYGKCNLRLVWFTQWETQDEDAQMYQDFYNRYKLYAGDASKGLLDMEYLYNRTENDLFVVEPTEKPMYRRIVNPLDTVSIFRDSNEKSVLFESKSFLAMENVEQFKDIAPGMLADTAYVRYETYRPQYMLVVGPTIHPAGKWCEEHQSATCEHAVPVDGWVEGRYLVNLVDTAIAWNKEHKHVKGNPYVNSENFYRLGFVQATHRHDSLIIAGDNKRLFVGNNDYNQAKFAFRYVDAEEGSFVIETANFKRLPDITEAEQDGLGYLKWMNGVVVVVDDIKNADIFNMDEEFEGLPTDNETIVASEVKVIAGEGQVTIAGAAGKKVVISNILGQVVANTVISSDNATIAAPAGVVVVAVEGEAAVKAIVK